MNRKQSNVKIILGSASPRRQKLLKDWGYDFDILIPGIDEKQIRSSDLRQLPLLVSKAKSKSLMDNIKSPAVVITCDTVVVHDGKLYEKPKDEREAREMLLSYGSKPAEVICGVVVTNTKTGKLFEGVDSSKVYFHKIPDNLIDEMIDHGKIFDFAGAFHPEDPPIKPYIAYVEGEMGTVLGLPRILTEKLVKDALNEQ